LVYNLTHQEFCEGQDKCSCTEGVTKVYEHHGKTGTMNLKEIPRKHPPVLTLLPLERRVGLPEKILGNVAVKVDLKANRLQVLPAGDQARAVSEPVRGGRRGRRQEAN
jgi:hypothetical protein